MSRIYNRAALAVSWLGIILAIHLWVQKTRNFDQGCWGVAPNAAPTLGGCTDPILEKASRLFGVSNAAWAYGFFFLIAALCMAKAILPRAPALLCHRISELTIAAGIPYCIYLLYYQAFVAKAFCPLCLVLGSFVALLAVLHLLTWRHGGHEPAPENERAIEMGYATGMTFLGGGCLVVVLVFIDQLGTRRLDEGSSAEQIMAVLQNPPAAGGGSQAHFVQTDWVSTTTPYIGTATGPTIAAFFDPNCPHCGGSYATILRLAEKYKGRAAFYVFPRMLWEMSALQIQSLELAKSSGKFFELWTRQFQRQRKGGLDFTAIEQLFRELDLDTTDLRQRLAAVRPVVLAQREKAQAAGINSTPLIFVDGRNVAGGDRLETNMSKLIEQAIEQYHRQHPAKEAKPGPGNASR